MISVQLINMFYEKQRDIIEAQPDGQLSDKVVHAICTERIMEDFDAMIRKYIENKYGEKTKDSS